jgi:predicted permease
MMHVFVFVFVFLGYSDIVMDVQLMLQSCPAAAATFSLLEALMTFSEDTANDKSASIS